MEFKEVLDKDIDRRKIAIGSRKGSILTIDLNKISSVIITGETGTGKSVMIRQILKQFNDKYTFEEVNFMIIDTSGVELLDYKDNNKTLISAYNDLDKSQEMIFKVLEEIDNRKNKLLEYSSLDIYSYNEDNNRKVPYLVVVVDDNQSLLSKEDVSSMINKIIDTIDVRYNMLFVLATNNTYNDLFDNYKDRENNLKISFDTSSSEEAENTGMPYSNDLLTGKFLIYNDGNYEEYNNFDLTDNNI